MTLATLTREQNIKKYTKRERIKKHKHALNKMKAPAIIQSKEDNRINQVKRINK